MKSMKALKTRWQAAGILTKALILVSLAFVMLFVAAPILPLSLNFTPSMSRGFYYTYDCTPIKGDIIQFKPAEKNWQLALGRGYVTDRMEGMIKVVVATSGDKVCWQDDNIFINGKFSGEVATVDSMGRPLGHEPECVTLAKGQFLPMAPDYPQSYDGRYFGLINSENVQFCVRPILTL